MSSEDLDLLRVIKNQALEEQRLRNDKRSLEDQVNALTRNLNACKTQLHHVQANLNSTNARSQELEQLLAQSEQNRAVCETDKHHEQLSRAAIYEQLSQELGRRQVTETALARQAAAMKNMSDFLGLMQSSSNEDKEATVQALTNRNDIGTLLMEVEAKKQALEALEEQRRSERVQFEAFMSRFDGQYLNIRQHRTNERSAEPDGGLQIVQTEGVLQAPAGKRKRGKRAGT
ncbi:MAG: hypothetical protein Q9167_003946 [Letrouitia subvulpina]